MCRDWLYDQESGKHRVTHCGNHFKWRRIYDDDFLDSTVLIFVNFFMHVILIFKELDSYRVVQDDHDQVQALRGI